MRNILQIPEGCDKPAVSIPLGGFGDTERQLLDVSSNMRTRLQKFDEPGLRIDAADPLVSTEAIVFR